MREISTEKKNNLEETEQFLKDQIVNNKQLEMSIKQSEKELVTIQDEQRKITEEIGAYTVEVRSIKKNLYYIFYIITLLLLFLISGEFIFVILRDGCSFIDNYQHRFTLRKS